MLFAVCLRLKVAIFVAESKLKDILKGFLLLYCLSSCHIEVFKYFFPTMDRSRILFPMYVNLKVSHLI